ncbi:ubiquitin-like-specific protease ESD4 isoform X2 [Magnolia sinica]|uniref:ubiquitin-like-specific protease ESD4 isoform X2 n=1 Tax=Magnolia sinica TaxID=86752 RepID=UPI002657C307|nr:ubiquitin-like-specific protease ESD4 isoform X2 [Magnolia sinica]
MGALTQNRKRLRLSSASPPLYSLDPEHIVDLEPLKKARITTMPPVPDLPFPPLGTPEISVSKIHRFPPPSPLSRPIHAPQRILKVFGYSVRKSRAEEKDEERASEMGNLSTTAERSLRVKVAKEEALSFLGKLETVELSDNKSSMDVDVEVLSVEEYKRLVEGHSVVSDQASEPKTPAASGLTVLISDSDDEGKMVDSPLADYGVEVKNSLYRELHASSKRRDSKLRMLDFELRLAQRKMSVLKFMRWAEDEKEEEEDLVTCALSGFNRRELLVTHESSNIMITRKDLQCLTPTAWLNDEVINVYLELLKERETRDPKKFLKCHFFSTFFYQKLSCEGSGYNYKAVKRWTTQKKLGYGLIECDKIFVPIHGSIHWCLAVINVKDEKFQYLDSLKGRNNQVLKVLARYFVDEVKDKSGNDVNVSSWKQEFVDDLPEQLNGCVCLFLITCAFSFIFHGYDCGMFMIKYVDFYSRGLDLCFGQEHMPYFRRRTAKEILMLKAE